MQAARIDEVVMRGLDARIHRLGKSIAKIRKALATAGWTAADFMNVAAGLLARGDTCPRSKQLPLRCWPIFDVRQYGRDCFGRHVWLLKDAGHDPAKAVELLLDANFDAGLLFS